MVQQSSRRLRVGAATGTLLLAATILASLAPTVGAATKTPKTDTIVIEYYTYYPMILRVAPGTSIKVENKDLVQHSLTSNNGKFNTGNIAPHNSKTIKAPKKPGTYHYHCDIHQYMKGSIVVT